MGMMLVHDYITQSLGKMCSLEGSVAFSDNFKGLFSFCMLEYPQQCCPPHYRYYSPTVSESGHAWDHINGSWGQRFC